MRARIASACEVMPSGPFSKTSALFYRHLYGFKSWAASHQISLNVHSNYGHRGRINVQEQNTSVVSQNHGGYSMAPLNGHKLDLEDTKECI